MRRQSGQIGSFAHRIRSWLLQLERDCVALAFACTHPKTPLAIKALCVFAVLYALNPTDLYSELSQVLALIDDFILLPGLIWLTIKLLRPDVLAECRDRATAWIEEKGKWRVRLGIGVVVAVWGIASSLIVQFLRA